MRAIGRVVFWTYARGSWQYDIACAVILAFIFLTPKSVFDGSLLARYFDFAAESSAAGRAQPDSALAEDRGMAAVSSVSGADSN